jgi:hypothetical protein
VPQSTDNIDNNTGQKANDTVYDTVKPEEATADKEQPIITAQGAPSATEQDPAAQPPVQANEEIFLGRIARYEADDSKVKALRSIFAEAVKLIDNFEQIFGHELNVLLEKASEEPSNETAAKELETAISETLAQFELATKQLKEQISEKLVQVQGIENKLKEVIAKKLEQQIDGTEEKLHQKTEAMENKLQEIINKKLEQVTNFEKRIEEVITRKLEQQACVPEKSSADTDNQAVDTVSLAQTPDSTQPVEAVDNSDSNVYPPKIGVVSPDQREVVQISDFVTLHSTDPPTMNANCAAYALQQILSNSNISLETLGKLLAPYTDSENRTSMFGVQQVASELGFDLSGVKITYEDLMKVINGGSEAIVYFSADQGHWVTVTAATNETVSYMDNGVGKTVSKEEFLGFWKEGYALVETDKTESFSALSVATMQGIKGSMTAMVADEYSYDSGDYTTETYTPDTTNNTNNGNETYVPDVTYEVWNTDTGKAAYVGAAGGLVTVGNDGNVYGPNGILSAEEIAANAELADAVNQMSNVSNENTMNPLTSNNNNNNTNNQTPDNNTNNGNETYVPDVTYEVWNTDGKIGRAHV